MLLKSAKSLSAVHSPEPGAAPMASTLSAFQPPEKCLTIAMPDRNTIGKIS